MLAFLLLSIQILPLISGTDQWVTLSLTEESVSDESGFVAFSKDTNLLQIRFTQLLEQTNLDFELSLKLYSAESQSAGLLGTVDFSWNTAKPALSILSFNENHDTYDTCSEPSGSVLTQSVPAFLTLDLDTGSLVTGDGVAASMGAGCYDGVGSWTKVTEELVGLVKFVKVYLKDSKSYGVDGYTGLQEYFIVDYRIAQACPSGQYLDAKAGCKACETGHYNTGGYVDECTKCSDGETVEEGTGASQDDCVTITCVPGSYLTPQYTCSTCSPGTYSPGGDTDTCSPCSADTYSTAPVSGTCTPCPEGGAVGEGLGLSAADCKEKEEEEEEEGDIFNDDDDAGSMLMFKSQQIWLLLSVLLFSLLAN